MKKKLFSVLFALVLVLSFSLVTAVPAAAATLTVDTSQADTPPNYHTIQAAIDVAGTGDTITVAAGTYVEDVTVDVAEVTIQGESLDAIVDGGFALMVDDITIDGLTIKNGRPGPLAAYHPAAISVEGESDGHTIINNVLIGNGSVPSNGILLCHSNDDVYIDGNEVYNWRRGITLRVYGSNVTISNNVVYDNLVEGIGLGDSTNCVVTYNDIYGNNTLVDTMGGGGISIYKGSGHVINYNKIYDNFHSGLSNYITTNLDATLNWWGDASGPGPDGTGNSVICDGGEVASHSPWLGATVGTSPMTFIVDDVGTEPTAGYIQTAVTAATAGDTISVAAGTYNAETFPIDVDVANLTIESVSGAASTIIDSVDAGQVIAISAAGVTIGGTDKGFIIRGKNAVANGLIYIGANDDTITDNRFIGDYYLMVLGPGISGAMVEDNVFLTYLAITENEVTGIYVNNDVTGSTFDGNHFPLGSEPTRYVDSGIYMATGTTADQTITISNNTFEGMGLREEAQDSMGCAAIELDGVGGITIEGNRIVNSNDGIWFAGDPLTGNVTIQNNTIIDNVWGIEIKDGVGTVGTITANYNKIVGNDTYGLLNLEADVTVDAQCNWWGGVAGPQHASNPYDDAAIDQVNNAVSDYVDYIPWMIQTDLADGWNIVSWPILCDWGEEEEPPDWMGPIYYFNSSDQHWGQPDDWSGCTELDAMYIKVDLTDLEVTTIPMSACISSDGTYPSQKAMKVGWNLVGLAQLYEMEASHALVDAYYGTGEAQLVGYSRVISPPVNQPNWSFLRDSVAIDEEDYWLCLEQCMLGEMPPEFCIEFCEEACALELPRMLPTKGYWVFMVNDGMLGGFTSTPIVEVEIL